jgi:transcriptional regulator with XRE-family HTH domain
VTLLRHIRLTRGWTAAELGMKAGLPQPAVSLIETGRLKPSPRQLELLASALHVNLPSALLEEVRLVDSQRAVVEQVVSA